jgi:hypothetical protein
MLGQHPVQMLEQQTPTRQGRHYTRSVDPYTVNNTIMVCRCPEINDELLAVHTRMNGIGHVDDFGLFQK